MTAPAPFKQEEPPFSVPQLAARRASRCISFTSQTSAAILLLKDGPAKDGASVMDCGRGGVDTSATMIGEVAFLPASPITRLTTEGDTK
jgi:hypothetical protein